MKLARVDKRQLHARCSRHGPCCAALLITACNGANSDEPQSEKQREPPGLATVGSPTVEGPPSDANYPPLNTGEPNTSGVFSTFIQLAEAPTDISDGIDTGTSPERDWRAFVAGDAFTTPPMLATQLERGAQLVRERSEVGNDLLTIMQPLRSVLPNQSATFDPHPRLLGYRPERARWTIEKRDGVEGATYPDPPELGELRHRGERLYCAVKNAARKQHEQSSSQFMGKYDLVEIPMLNLVILRVEPTLTIEEPMRLDSGQNDGAQAFVLPFQSGVRASIFPQLGLEFLRYPEMTLPVSTLVADSEVTTLLDFGNRQSSKVTTATHATMFGSSAYEGTAESNDIPLPIRIGPIGLSLRLGLTAGMASCSEHDVYANCRNTLAHQVGRLIDKVQYGASAPLEPLAPGPRGVWDGQQVDGWTKDDTQRNATTGDYNDAPWNVDDQLWTIDIPNSGLAPLQMTLPDPLAARMVQNNDKSLMTEANFGLTMSFIAQAGLRMPETGGYYVQFSADVRAGFTLSASVLQRFREQEEVLARTRYVDTPEFPNIEVRDAVPLTALTVTPGTQTEPIRLDLSGGLDIGVHGGPFTLAFHVNLFKVGTNVGDAGTPKWWTESHRLRLTTMQSYKGQVESGELSHLPGGELYTTFEDTATCAAPQPMPPAPYSRCEAEPATSSGPIEVPMCLVVPVRVLQPDHDRDPELNCFLKVQDWFHTGTNQEQDFHGDRAIARVLVTGADYEGSAHAAIDCANEYTRVGRDAQDATSFIQYVPCDASGTILEEPIAPSFNTGAPEPGSASAPCHR